MLIVQMLYLLPIALLLKVVATDDNSPIEDKEDLFMFIMIGIFWPIIAIAYIVLSEEQFKKITGD